MILYYFIAIVAGLLSGFLELSFLENAGVFIADLFIKMFQCISTPIIALSLIVTMTSKAVDRPMQELWKKTISATVMTTVLAATVACGLYVLIAPQSIAQSVAGIQKSPSGTFLEHLLKVFPQDIFTPFVEHQVIGVLFLGIVMGLAIRAIPDEASKDTVITFFKGIHSVFLIITSWIVAIIPIGLYGFITKTILELREGADFTGLGAYLAVVVLANCVQGFVILPLWLYFKGIAPFDAMKKMMPALVFAFFSKSSTATLPITMETVEKRFSVSPETSRFVLPLCTTINMNGCAAFIFTTVIFVMQNAGIAIDATTLLTWIFVATVAAIGNAGVPMGCFFLSASLLASMDVPIELLGLILPFYSLIDMLETALNVWSDSCVVLAVENS